VYVASSSVVVSSSAVYVSSSSSYPSSASASASATPYPDCWNTCFEQNDVTSEADLCGNTAVNECIYYTCCKEEDMQYWSWYNGYCPAVSSSASATPSSTFSTVVSSSAIGYSSSASPVGYSSASSTSSSSTVPSATPTGNCWEACFEENDVKSEAELCGNDNVSKCIAVTCSSELDQAYWTWYDGYCAVSTGATTVVTVVTPTTPIIYTTPTGETSPVTWATVPYTTTYVSTTSYATPVESSPATTGWPSPPAGAPPAYTSPVWTAPYSYPAASGPVGTAASSGYGAKPTPSSWVPVAATGAGAANKPAGLIAVVLAVAAFF